MIADKVTGYPPRELLLVRMPDPSLEPTFKEGAEMVFDPLGEPVVGKPVLVNVDGNGPFVRLFEAPGSFEILAAFKWGDY